MLVKSGSEIGFALCIRYVPTMGIITVDLNTKRGLVEKSGIKTRQEVLTRERKYSRFSSMDSAKVLAA